ncbi:adenosylmethionine decarboxylase [Candidatus Woesearchaeota archaeon]|nr:adenosylmethionine decarboxylase [Candidatus Woesearchaeota archaeon]
MQNVHIILDLHDCPASVLEREHTVKDALREAVQKASLNSVGEMFHQFQPQGVTGVILLTQSHVTIHTWPERNAAYVDIFSCAPDKAAIAAEVITQRLKAARVERRVLER